MKRTRPGAAEAVRGHALRCAGAGLATTLALLAVCRAQPVRPPHIVFLMIDTLRARNLGAYGYARPTSPAIDRFAREAVLFEEAISVGGNTTTAMAGVFTGRYAFFEYGEPWSEAPYGMDRFRTRADASGLPGSMTTLAEHLSAAGYRTAGFITNPYMKRTFWMHQGFGHYEEIFDAGNGSFGSSEQLLQQARRHLSALDWDQPTFLYLHFMDTHGPYREPDPRSTGGSFAARGPMGHEEAWRSWERLDNVDPAAHSAEIEYMTAAYDTAVRHVDQAVGEVIELYRQHGLLEQTVFVITADHGDEFLEHGGTTHKGTLFEELVHVPLLIRAPAGLRGVRVPRLVRNFDATATILDYASVPRPPDMDARSLRPLLEGRTYDGPATAYAGFPGIRMIRTDRFKLLRRQDGSELFFDLEEDPGETRSLAASKDPRIQKVHAALGRALDHTAESLRRQGPSASGAREPATVDAATRAQLRALGYLE